MDYLIYSSHRQPNCTDQELQQILHQSRAHNGKENITGILLHSNHFFIQYLEGEPEIIMALYAKIKRDSRHTNVGLLSTGKISERQFSSWQMGYKDISSETLRLYEAQHAGEKEIFTRMLSGQKPQDEIGAIAVLRTFFDTAA